MSITNLWTVTNAKQNVRTTMPNLSRKKLSVTQRRNRLQKLNFIVWNNAGWQKKRSTSRQTTEITFSVGPSALTTHHMQKRAENALEDVPMGLTKTLRPLHRLYNVRCARACTSSTSRMQTRISAWTHVQLRKIWSTQRQLANALDSADLCIS